MFLEVNLITFSKVRYKKSQSIIQSKICVKYFTVNLPLEENKLKRTQINQ